MGKDNSNVTIREVYTLIDNKMGEINKSFMRLENKFDSLESGRLTNIESKVANMEGRMMMIPLMITVAINVFFFIIQYVLGKK